MKLTYRQPGDERCVYEVLDANRSDDAETDDPGREGWARSGGRLKS